MDSQRSADKMLIMAGGAQVGKTSMIEAVKAMAKDNPDLLDICGEVEEDLCGLEPVMPKLDVASAKLAMEAMAMATKEAEEKAKKLREALIPRPNRDLGVGWTRQVVGGQKPSRNQPCPCGSKMKFKYCHGKG